MCGCLPLNLGFGVWDSVRECVLIGGSILIAIWDSVSGLRDSVWDSVSLIGDSVRELVSA